MMRRLIALYVVFVWAAAPFVKLRNAAASRVVCTCILGLVAFAAPAFALDASNVLVIANSKAEGSVEIAEYYAAARAIPAERILKVEASDREEISWDDFRTTLLEPVTKAVQADEKILCLCLTRGVPLKIKASDPKKTMQQKDCASVDSELSLLLRPDHKLDSFLESDYYDSKEPLTRAHKLLAVTRLDGPTIEIALGLIDKAILAESLGLEGTSYLDTRGITKDDGYGQRDKAMKGVGDAWKAAELPYEHDDKGGVVDISQREEPLLHYYGWYAGNPGKWTGRPRFRTGGIGVHLHSFSGVTVRDPRRNWVAPLLDWGVTATYGTVYEPFTVGFPYEWVFWDRLCKGHCFAEAGLMACRVQSWQAVFVGDPLYTPYAGGAKAAREKWAASRESVSKLLTSETTISDEDKSKEALAARIINQWLSGIDAISSEDPSAALNRYAALLQALQGYGLDDAVKAQLKDLDKIAKKAWKELEKQLKKDPANVAEYERALVDWKGIEIHGELVEYREKLAKAQEKIAGKLYKKAAAKAKRASGALEAWQLAREAMRYTYAESGTEAKDLVARIEKELGDALKEQANKAIEAALKKLSKEVEYQKFDKAIPALRELIATHPECEQRKAAEELLKKAREGRAEAEKAKRK